MAIARSPDVPAWARSRKSEVFGNQIPSADPDGDGVAVELALRFPGQQATDASGLFYNYQREYDPAVGRYSQSDPIGLNAGVSTYGYVISNPTRFIDPLGLTTTLITTYNFGIANHSAIHVSRPGKPDFLYDPSGTYAPGGRRGTGGLFEGRDASLASYKKYQVGTGSRVELTVIPLTPEQELTLIANAEEWGMHVASGVRATCPARWMECVDKENTLPGCSSQECKGGRMSSQMKDRLISSLICFTLSVSVNSAGWIWISAFMKIGAMRVPYVLLLSLLLSVTFYALSRCESMRRIPRSLVVGLIAGLVLGVVAVTSSNLAIDGGACFYRALRDSEQRRW